jgi:hypothetical protein
MPPDHSHGLASSQSSEPSRVDQRQVDGPRLLMLNRSDAERLREIALIRLYHPWSGMRSLDNERELFRIADEIDAFFIWLSSALGRNEASTPTEAKEKEQ